MRAVRRWRSEGRPVFFTVDAGPHVKVFCPPDEADEVRIELDSMPRIGGTLMARPGHGARVIEED